MASVTPRHVLCVLGNWKTWDAVKQAIAPFAGFTLDEEFSSLEPVDGMVEAFEASYDRVDPTMTDGDWHAIEAHRAVAYILSPKLARSEAAAISGAALRLVAALFEQGGLAAKAESAGIAHGRARWQELASDYAAAAKRDDEHKQGAVLYWTWVRRPLLADDDSVYYTCGLHLLGLRDIEIDAATELDEALEWIDLLGLYLAADRPTRTLKDGEGFRLADAGPRRILRLADCTRYAPDDFMFNPYGYVRLEE